MTDEKAFDTAADFLKKAALLDPGKPAYEKMVNMAALWMQLGSLIADSGKS